MHETDTITTQLHKIMIFSGHMPALITQCACSACLHTATHARRQRPACQLFRSHLCFNMPWYRAMLMISGLQGAEDTLCRVEGP
eukprot:1159763-Pelagomonas_calceolata.AAC.2